MPFLLLVFSFFVLVITFSQKTNHLVWVCISTFVCFIRLRVDLIVVFKRIIYSLKLILILIGYRRFSYFSHAVKLWFVVFSRLRWLFWIII